MLTITPALFISNGKCSRLQPGSQITYYEKNPLNFALELEDQGFKRIYVVDLNGARTGRISNHQTLELISGHTNLEIVFGGGITYDDDVRMAFESGAAQITAASIATIDKEMFASWLISFGRKKIILSIDEYDEKLLVKGRQQQANLDIIDFIEYFYERSVLYVKCTELLNKQKNERTFNIYRKILSHFPDIKLIASGGITNTDQIKSLSQMGISEIIIGRALSEGKISYKDLKPWL